MKKMTTKTPRQQSWLRAIAEAAKEQDVPLPTFTGHTMGGVRSSGVGDGRFVTFKRRLVPAEQAKVDGVEWTLWLARDDVPVPVAAFRESAAATRESVATVLSLLRGWLVDGWTCEEAKAAVGRHPRVQPVADLPVPSAEKREYWLSEERGFGIVVTKDRWSLYARGACLTSWRFKDDGTSGDHLDLAILDRLCSWIAKQWPVIAYGSDFRPLPIRGFSVAASRAYENAELARAPEKDGAVPAWWSRHAIRAADAELPNVFFERQADEMVVSWDARPSPTRFYQVPAGEETFRVALAVPALRRLVADRLKPVQFGPADRPDLEAIVSSDAAAGYAAVRYYNPAISDVWLAQHGFSDKDAQELATSGTSRHPLVGLLRSSQGSSLLAADFDTLLNLLKPGNAQNFALLRELARGLSPAINAWEPWESGYHLARLIRTRLGFAPSDYVNVEDVVREMGIAIQEVVFHDPAILGVCVGTPGYFPLVVLNQACEDVTGVSGRRVTLAHELCHLLFDRASLRSLARFEGGGADSDRLIEMRANAFAVELLVPMATLVGDNGQVVDDARLGEIAVQQAVSSHALQWHARNLRNRLAGR
jgi:Zn-dependent peptidase ImmA (M78 family)